MSSIKEVLTEIREYIQACMEAGETDLRGILSFVDSVIIEYEEKAKDGGGSLLGEVRKDVSGRCDTI